MSKPRLSKKQKVFIEVFEKKAGNVAEASKAAKITRQLFYHWMKTNERFAEDIINAQDSLIDRTESRLYENIEKGNQRAIEYYLDAKAKDRGYGKALALTGKDGKDLLPPVLSEEKLKEELERMGFVNEPSQLDSKEQLQ